MKLMPIAQGTGVPGNQASTPQDATKIIRAKAIASGQIPPEPVVEETNGDRQIDRIKKIKMRTQVSPERQTFAQQALEITEKLAQEASPASQTIEPPIENTIEPDPVIEETKQLSPQFAALAKAKRALQVKERELAQKEEDLKTQNASNLEEYVSKAELKANPLKVFDLGVTYDQLTEALLGNQNGSSLELQQLKADIKALKEEMSGQLSERDKLQEQQVLAQMKRSVDQLTSQGEDFEAIRLAKAQDDVVELIHRTWQKTGEILDETEAASLVEKQLIEESLPFAKIKKVQLRLTPQQDMVQSEPIVEPKPNTRVMRTLTNRDVARPGPMDRRTRAIQAFNGTLKRG